MRVGWFIVACLLAAAFAGCDEGASSGAPSPSATGTASQSPLAPTAEETATPIAPIPDEPDLSYLDNYRLSPGDLRAIDRARENIEAGRPYELPANLPPPSAEPRLHGEFLLQPAGWIGPLPPSAEPKPFFEPTTDPLPHGERFSLEEARTSDLWQEPGFVPDGFELRDGYSQHLDQNVSQIWARPAGSEPGYIEALAWRPYYIPVVVDTFGYGPGANLWETATVDGYEAVFWRPPPDAAVTDSAVVYIFNRDEGVTYVTHSSGGVAFDQLIEMTRSLYTPGD